METRYGRKRTYVEIAAVLVADTSIAVGAITACHFVGALLKTRTRARVRSVGSGNGVGLPNIHLGAAGTDLTLSSIWVVVRWVPALYVSLAVNPLDVVGALGVAVTSSVLGTGLVVALVKATVGGHLDEVQSAVQTARQLRNIDVEGELLANEVEHLVLAVGLHKVGTGADIGSIFALGNELQGQGIAAGRDTVGSWRSQSTSNHC